MKVKRENIKLNCEMNNLTNQTFIFAQEIWESESIIDDLDFYIPLDLKIKPTTKRKKHGKRKLKIFHN